MSWPLELLDNVAERGSGHTPSQKHPEYWNDGIKWVSLADSSALDKRYIYDTAKKISELGLKNSSAVLHPKGTVILSRDAGVGKSAILGDQMAVSQHFIAWRCDGTRLDSEYLYQWLQSEKAEFERIATGSTVKTIGLGHFQRLRLPVPPIEMQKSIARALATWDTAIQKTEQLIAAKERHYIHELSRLFSGHGMTTRTYRLSDISYIPQKLPAAPRDDDIYVLVRLYCKGVERNERQKKAPTKNGRPILRRSAGELLVGRQNIHNGGFGVVPKSLDGALASNAITSLSFYPDKACTEYVFFFLSRPSYYKKLEKVMGGTGQKEISERQLLAISIPLPDIRTQTAIARYLNALREEIDLLGQSVAALKTQKHGLMQKLLTGQWRLPIPETHEVLSDG